MAVAVAVAVAASKAKEQLQADAAAASPDKAQTVPISDEIRTGVGGPALWGVRAAAG